MKVCVNFSGGKDSTAMLLKMIENGEQIDKIVFADTLLELPEMYEFINKVEKYINRPIIRTKPNNNFFKWFFGTFTRGKHVGERRGFPYVCSPCWYQREAKVIPMSKVHKDCDVICIGYAKGEEKRIMKDKKFRYPLIEYGMTEDDCIKYCKDKNLLNPLYKKFKRLGCFLCHKQNKDSLKTIQRDYPTLWNIMLMLEECSNQGFSPNFKLEEVSKK